MFTHVIQASKETHASIFRIYTARIADVSLLSAVERWIEAGEPVGQPVRRSVKCVSRIEVSSFADKPWIKRRWRMILL